MILHVVQQGETLDAIARRYTVSVRRLALENGLAQGKPLVPGQVLAVLYPLQTVQVRRGETLAALSRRTGVSRRQIWRCNPGLLAGQEPQAGRRLILRYRQRLLGRLETSGYAYPGTREELLFASLPAMERALPFAHAVTRLGGLSPLDSDDMLQAFQEAGTKPVLSVANLRDGEFDGALVHAILGSEEAQKRLIAEISAKLKTGPYAGVDLDFERIPAADRERYPSFLQRLSDAVAPDGYKVRTAVAAKNSDNASGRWVEGLDYAAIGKAVSAVLLMTYDYGYASGPAQAVAPLPQVRETLRYAVTRIPREKILLGIPNYGYNWPLPYEAGKTRARSVTNEEAIDLARTAGVAIQYDEQAQAPWFRYTEDGTQREVWFEDARSLRAKLRLAVQFGLRGVGFWNLSRPFRQGWTVLSALVCFET